jgi:excisionase family DNA binding protein
MPDPLGESTRPLTPDEVSERWDCSARLVVRLCQEGKLRHFRVGKLYRITPAAVTEFESRPLAAAATQTQRPETASEKERVKEALRLARSTR